MNKLPIIEKKYLRYDFKATETNELSLQLANKTQELSQVEDEKSSIASQYKSKIDTIKGSLGSLANKISSGYEMREVECEIKYHYPQQGHKQYTRKDTNESWNEKMSSEEWNLFNQVGAEGGNEEM